MLHSIIIPYNPSNLLHNNIFFRVSRLLPAAEPRGFRRIEKEFHYEEYFQFLLLDGDRIIGESVINEFTDEGKSANFRIAIFSADHCGKGLGSWMTGKTCTFAFDVLKLEKIMLDVFAFNPRAIRTYEKAGFVKTGYIEDDDLILMELTKENFIRQ